MAQESDDVSSKFSTLNINATEFVPSFCVDEPEDESPVTAQTPVVAPEEPASEAVATINTVPASTISSSNNNGTCTVAISCFDVVATH